MNIIQYIHDTLQAGGVRMIYGDPWQLNVALGDIDFSAEPSNMVAYCYLLRDTSTTNGAETAQIAVFFASLCDFDFDPMQVLAEQERLKRAAKTALLGAVVTDNKYGVSGEAWQYGYNDYAENVCWVAMRATFTALSVECVRGGGDD